MKLGDYIRYRDWKDGDTPFEETPLWRRGWGQTGIIVELGDWKLGSIFWPGEMALIWTGQEYVEVCTRDVEVICIANFVQTLFDNRAKSHSFMV